MKHGIEWLNFPGRKGETWNPWVGCSAAGPGCKNCWACRQANRFQNTRPQYEGTVRDGQWTGRVNRAPDPGFYKPLHWRNPRAIFPCSMSDFFHEGADEWREQAWRIMERCYDHLFLILTKRPERIPDCLPSFGKKEWPWPHVWLGASVENQEAAEERIPHLLRAPAAKRFLSIEPLLGPINLCQLEIGATGLDALNGIEENPFGAVVTRAKGRGLDWVIVGGESGPGARPMKAEWARDIRNQCKAAGVPFFMKQMSKRAPIPKDLQIKEYPK